MRDTTIMITCDNPDCVVCAPIPSVEETPPGWYIVIPVREQEPGKVAGAGTTAQRAVRDGFTLCCLECVGAWGLYREEALRDNGTAPS